MTKEKLFNLYQSEKQRITEQVFNPIFEVINNKKYNLFFNNFIKVNINLEIDKQALDLEKIEYNDEIDLEENIKDPQFKKIYDDIFSKIYTVLNLDIFKLVFGEASWEEWALNFVKYLIFSFYESQNLSNISFLIENNTFDETFYDINEILSNLEALIFKTIYGFTFTSLDKYEYWANTTGISQEQYNSFYEIVAKNNPAIFLVNSILYFLTNLKNGEIGDLGTLIQKQKIHRENSFESVAQIKISYSKTAYDIILNHFAALTLYEKLQISLWKAIQNLVFGTTQGKKVIVMRTITEINVNIRQVWQLDSESVLFFKYLKFQALFNEKMPNSLTNFLNQDIIFLNSNIKPIVNKFDRIKKTIELEQKQKEQK